ncbi:hypothetical protein HU200_064589 [Digitaria exilis]|uniref:Uncharacterized protein n=1 Tax=Digitaria exilis TaxID=1010633 RepID=A0A835A0Z5_9POAL|nr:hypothetical protein HU200_064589 [Digitaria exilis]
MRDQGGRGRTELDNSDQELSAPIFDSFQPMAADRGLSAGVELSFAAAAAPPQGRWWLNQRGPLFLGPHARETSSHPTSPLRRVTGDGRDEGFPPAIAGFNGPWRYAGGSHNTTLLFSGRIQLGNADAGEVGCSPWCSSAAAASAATSSATSCHAAPSHANQGVSIRVVGVADSSSLLVAKMSTPAAVDDALLTNPLCRQVCRLSLSSLLGPSR